MLLHCSHRLYVVTGMDQTTLIETEEMHSPEIGTKTLVQA
jgi:hypothetical protein